MKKTIKKFVSDKDGRVVIVQSPNLPIIGWLMCLVAAQLVGPAYLKTGFQALSGAFIFLWAYLEIVQGSSYFRRMVGLIVMSIVVTMFFV